MAKRYRKIQYALLIALVVWIGIIAIRSKTKARAQFYTQLDDTLWELRQKSTAALRLGPSEHRKYLADLWSPEAPVRWAAADKLGHWADSESVSALVAAMQDHRGTRRTCLMAQALGKVGSAEAVPALIDALKHPRNRDLRVCAAHALAEIGDSQAVDPLARQAEDLEQPRDDRAAAIIALGDLGFVEGLPALSFIATNDKDQGLRILARPGIRKIRVLRENDPVPELLGLLSDLEPGIHTDWVLRQLHRRWDARVETALNKYIRHNTVQRHLTLATAILLHRNALHPDTLLALAQSSTKPQRWLADFVAEHNSTPTPR